MKKLLNLLKGKKTIITGVVMIVLGCLQGHQEIILNGLGFIFLRVGLNKQNFA